MMIILLLLFAWYVFSMIGAAMINQGEDDDNISASVQAGCFLAPLVVSMLLLAHAEWQFRRFANFIGMPLIGPAGDDPMEYLP